jgi:hypothetical protein
VALDETKSFFMKILSTVVEFFSCEKHIEADRRIFKPHDAKVPKTSGK